MGWGVWTSWAYLERQISQVEAAGRERPEHMRRDIHSSRHGAWTAEQVPRQTHGVSRGVVGVAGEWQMRQREGVVVVVVGGLGETGGMVGFWGELVVRVRLDGGWR